ncbi:MAG: fibronectin type III domain-containing protein [Bacteroidales bacterium]|nr:fibronectin type III domain-containing protein [Bacteroidales bacterium]
MKKHLMTLLMAVLVSLGVVAQNNYTIDVLGGTEGQKYIPSNNYFKYGSSQTIYLSSDIGISGTITSIAYKTQGYTFTRNFTLYMAETDQSSYTGTSSAVAAENFQEVFSGDVTYSNTEWTVITLTTPFEYSGEGNLVVEIIDLTGSYGGNNQTYNSTTVSASRGLYFSSDSSIPSLADPKFANVVNQIPSIKLGITSTQTYCEAPANNLQIVPSAIDASISWSAVANAEGYNVEYKLHTDSTWTSTHVTDTTAQLTDLTPTTQYDVRVQNDCGSVWISSSFRTTMIPEDLPYLNTFSEYEDQNWLIDNAGYSSQWTMGALPETYALENGLFITADGTTPGYANSSSVVVAEKAFNLGEESTVHLEFDLISGGESYYDYLKVFLAPATEEFPASTGASFAAYGNTQYAVNFAEYLSQTGYSNNGYQYKINLTQGNVIHYTGEVANPTPNGVGKLVFVWKNDGSGGTQPGAIISNLLLGNIPCATPTAAMDSIGANGATMTITGNADSYTLRYKSETAEDWTEEIITSTSYEFTDLSPLTIYNVQISATCGSDVSMTYALSFKTACAPMTEGSLPYSENFDSYTFSSTEHPVPDCWTKGNGTVATGMYSSSYSANSGTNYLKFDGWNTVALPQVERSISELMLTFYARPESTTFSGVLHVGYMTDVTDTATFVSVSAIDATSYPSATYAVQSVSFADVIVPEENPVIAFRYEPQAAHNNYYFFVDDVVLDFVPACEAPTALASSNPTAETITLSWQGPEDVSFNIYYKAASDDTFTLEEDAALDNGSYLLQGLTPNTNYTWYVATVCPDGSEAASLASGSFKTTCSAIAEEDLPYIEDFESYGTTSYPLPDCWTRVNGASSGVWGTNAQTGSNCFRLYGKSTIALPATAAEMNSLMLTFSGKPYGTTYADTLQVGYMTDVTDINTFVPVQSIYASDFAAASYEPFVVTFTNAPVDAMYVAFRFNPSYTYNYFYIDNLTLDLAPNCLAPMSLSASNITTTSADLTWESTAENHTLYYKQQGDSTYTTVENVVLTDGVYTLNGLQPLTTYSWYVAAVCEDGSMTDALNTNNIFTTQMEAESLPYSTTFAANEDRAWSLNNTSSLSWVMGSPTNYADSVESALYVTLDGTTAGYSANYTNVVTAEKLFDLGTTSTVHLEFDMRVGGESFYDYLKVFFAPASMEFPAGTSTPSYAGYAYSTNALDFSDYASQSNYSAAATNQYMYSLSNGIVHVSMDLNNNFADGLAKLVFVWRNDNSTSTDPISAIITNVSLSAQSCITPSNLAVNNVTGEQATISWTGTSEAYSLQYKLASESSWTAVTVADTTYTLTSLLPATTYDVRVAVQCDENTLSSFATTSFTTPCAVVSTFPYTQGFENGTNCWMLSNGFSLEQDFQHTGNYSLYYDTEIVNEGELISPVFDLTSLTDPYVSFYHVSITYDTDYDTLGVYYRTSAEADWTYLASYTQGYEFGQWYEGDRLYDFDSITLPNPSATYQLKFVPTYNGGVGIFLDDITIDAVQGPACVNDTVSQDTILCEGTVVTFFDQTLTNAGTYQHVEENENGCTTTTILTLTYLPTSTDTIEASICEGEAYVFNGDSLTTAGTYTATLQNMNGCDSTVTLTLTVNSIAVLPTEATICEGETYQWNGQSYTVAGEYTAELTDSLTGCSYTDILILTVNVVENTSDSVSINAGETYEWNGQTLTTAGEYTAELTDENGCAYTATLTLTVNQGLLDADNTISLALYPNPTTSNATLSVEGLNEEAMVVVTDIQGRTIQSNKLAQGQTAINISTENLASGVYYVRVITTNATRTEKLIKK